MSKRILIVDDQEAVLFALAEYLGALGYQVERAADYETAETLLVARSYALVIADLCLTGRTGSEGLDVIRLAREHCPGTLAILMTAHGSPQIEAEAHQLGAARVLDKPLGLSHLADTVADLLGRRCDE